MFTFKTAVTTIRDGQLFVAMRGNGKLTWRAGQPEPASTIFITGATGTFGSEVLRRLRAHNQHIVCLVRGTDDKHAEHRLRAAAGPNAGVEIVRGDVREPLCGVSAANVARLTGRVDTILHCAASLEFKDAEAAELTNVEGVRNVLALAEALDIDRFCHVSTAYVAGDAKLFRESDLVAGQTFRNSYEKSKADAERLVHAWAGAAENRNFSILRPSIIVGNEDGSTPGFDGYYTYAKILSMVASGMRRRTRLPEGISVAPDGTVTLPLTLKFLGAATLNMVPLDWASTVATELLGLPFRNETYHLVHPNPPRLSWVVETSLEALGIAGMTILLDDTPRPRQALAPVLARLQSSIDGVVDSYLPYTSGEAVFTFNRVAAALGHRFREPPPITSSFLVRMIEYAERVNWGERPRDDQPDRVRLQEEVVR